MKSQEAHLSDEEVLLAVDGELPPRDRSRVEAHLLACWTCRVHKQKVESAIAGFIGVHEREPALPVADGPRALLRARLGEASKTGWLNWRFAAMLVGMLAAGLLVGVYLGLRSYPRVVSVSVPNRQLTPGATVLVDTSTLCREPGAKNRTVSLELQRQVFRAYGIANAEPRHYEVDYLITPALGGAEDIHNLWPQSYSGTPWNAQVKDALEDYLRDSVCEGKVDLATAQRDVADDWIAAYKKYFHTDKPL